MSAMGGKRISNSIGSTRAGFRPKAPFSCLRCPSRAVVHLSADGWKADIL